jgi:hypothetical protein
VANQAEEPEARRPRPANLAFSMIAAVLALVLGLAGLAVCIMGAATQVLPREFTPAQQQSIMNWEIAARWRKLPAGVIFPANISYLPSASLQELESLQGPALRFSAQRAGIAPQSNCSKGLDAAVSRVLDAAGCQSLLRATYTDSTDSYVVTIGAAVLPGPAQARAARARLPHGTKGVTAIGFTGTASVQFTNARRQLSSSVAAGPYILLYTVGFADARPTLPVASDPYTTAEMTSFGQGVTGAVEKTLAAAPAAPHCPGAPGC